MFGIGSLELIVIVVLALILFGPKKLPEFARVVGRTIHELRRQLSTASDSIRQEIEPDVADKSDTSSKTS